MISRSAQSFLVGVGIYLLSTVLISWFTTSIDWQAHPTPLDQLWLTPFALLWWPVSGFSLLLFSGERHLMVHGLIAVILFSSSLYFMVKGLSLRGRSANSLSSTRKND
ncbi:MAG: hypothetical protein V1778_00715 [bacterium]